MLKSGIYDFVICRGGTDMCFVLGFGRKRPDLKQYRISGLTEPKPTGFLKGKESGDPTVPAQGILAERQVRWIPPVCGGPGTCSWPKDIMLYKSRALWRKRETRQGDGSPCW